MREASQDAIFHPTRDFDLNDEAFLKLLQPGVNKYFGGIAEQLLNLCLNGAKAQAAALKS